MPYTETMKKLTYTQDPLRLAHQNLALRIKPELFLTLATNQHMRLDKMKRLTRRFLREMDRSMLGNKHTLQPIEKRMEGLLYVEHEHSNIHVHGLMTRPYCNRCGLQCHAIRIWGKICPSGSVVIKDVGDIKKRSEYVTKEAFKHRFFERQFFTASEMMAAA